MLPQRWNQERSHWYWVSGQPGRRIALHSRVHRRRNHSPRDACTLCTTGAHFRCSLCSGTPPEQSLSYGQLRQRAQLTGQIRSLCSLSGFASKLRDMHSISRRSWSPVLNSFRLGLLLKVPCVLCPALWTPSPCLSQSNASFQHNKNSLLTIGVLVQCLTCNLCGIGWIFEVLVQGVLCAGWVLCVPHPSAVSLIRCFAILTSLCSSVLLKCAPCLNLFSAAARFCVTLRCCNTLQLRHKLDCTRESASRRRCSLP